MPQGALTLIHQTFDKVASRKPTPCIAPVLVLQAIYTADRGLRARQRPPEMVSRRAFLDRLAGAYQRRGPGHC